MSGRFSIAGRRVLVTGASSGLGWHFAGMLAAEGAQVVVAARRLERLDALVEQIQAAGGSAQALAMDVASRASVQAAFDALQGQGPLDIVVNNAGVTVTRSALAQTEQDWDAVLDTNLKGVWQVATEAARRWVEAKRPGCIINIASILGERVAGSVAPYAISKAGIVQMTKALALEFARHDIRVNALAPGYVETDLNRDFLASEAGQRLRARIPQRAFAQPGDLDGALLLLASDAGRRMTGAVVPVDGGHLVSSL